MPLPPGSDTPVLVGFALGSDTPIPLIASFPEGIVVVGERGVPGPKGADGGGGGSGLPAPMTATVDPDTGGGTITNPGGDLLLKMAQDFGFAVNDHTGASILQVSDAGGFEIDAKNNITLNSTAQVSFTSNGGVQIQDASGAGFFITADGDVSFHGSPGFTASLGDRNGAPQISVGDDGVDIAIGTLLGFFGATPVDRPDAPMTVQGIYDALAELGLLAPGGTIGADAAPPVEAVRFIGGGGNPAFENSWGNYGDPFQVGSFYKDRGRTFLAGQFSGGSEDTVLFTLPVGYRPTAREVIGGVIVWTDGSVVIHTSWPVGGFYNINNISFVASDT